MYEKQMAENNLIYKVITGSYAYGTRTPESDMDYTGIFIPNKDYVVGIKRIDEVDLGTKKSSEQRKNNKDDVDFKSYSIIKFIQLAINNNPNIVELFFMPDNCILKCNDEMDLLLDNYRLFISKKCFHTFTGYAYSQRKKLEVKKENMTGRIELVEKYGYDTKFASHLIRLLYEGLELLVEGRITLPLTQNNLILDIKNGKYTLAEVFKKADELDELIQYAYVRSALQQSADVEEINKLQIYILEKYWSKNV